MMKKRKTTATYGVIGLGRFGTALAVTLAQSDNEVIVIDREESTIREMRQYTEYAFVSDDLSMETLEEAGIQNCDVVIVCIGEKSDESPHCHPEKHTPKNYLTKVFSPDEAPYLFPGILLQPPISSIPLPVLLKEPLRSHEAHPFQ